MKNSLWSKALKASPDPHRAKHFLDLFAATNALPALQKSSAEQARILAALFSGSQALSALLLAHPDWLPVLAPEVLKFPRRKQGLRNEVSGWLNLLLEAQDYAGAFSRLRDFKQREMLRIAARDLARLADVSEITQEISDLADVCLDSVWRTCHQQFTERHGRPWHQDPQGRWQPTAGAVIGLGKLGGQELNYSSDVDVIFLYTEEGSVFKEPAGRKRAQMTSPVNSLAGPARGRERPRLGAPSSMTNHQFFNRLAEAFIAEVARMAPEGTLYRIDLRLRPEGDAGPLSRSLSGYENYYTQWGQTWERMMLIKGRGVTGDEAVAAEFLEMIQPFRYPRSINESVLSEVAALKYRIENEVVKAGELERNVKLGRGGIREIEFIAQALQLLHAGRQPFLQGSQTLPCLEKLVQYEWLSSQESRVLAGAYRFLREVEHRLQMEHNLQTHTIPGAHHAQERLARLMGCRSLKMFSASHQANRRNVRRIFNKLLKAETAQTEAASPFPRQFEGAEAEWKSLLAAHGFKDADKTFRVLREFVEGPGYVHVSPRTSELAYQLLPKLFALCPSPPDASCRYHQSRSELSPSPREGRAGRGLGRGVPLLASVGVGADFTPQSLTSDLSPPTSQPRLSDPDRVITRLDSFIAAYGARGTLFELWNSNPAIFELLVLLFDRSEFLAELAIRTPDLVDELVTSGRLRQRKSAEETLADLRHGLADQDQYSWLRRYHQAELMRIGLRDILGLADFEQYLVELSALADACLQYALEVVMRKHNLKTPPFVIIGLGKLGGAEIDYGSDLDIIFVAELKTKGLDKLAKLAAEVMELLSLRTEQGMLFHTDARLRPDGEKGLLVNKLAAFEEYYRQRAQLWEIQSLTRTRPVAGDWKLGEKFQKMAAALTNFKQPGLPLAAYAPDWKPKIHRMRMRIEKERTPAGKDELAIKTGKGGLMDAEFIAQTLCLENGWHEANTVRALERGQKARVLPDAASLIENYRQLRRIEGILRRWSYEGETVLPDDPAPYYRVSVRCGFASPEAFRASMATCRTAIRKAYLKVFQPSGTQAL
jgi:[glutamine synthetase] adenylyltransferase / [glutamine synthetase]-adenylyl-L-tyrosine phosphorylase